MDNSASIMAQGPGESSLAVPVQLADLAPAKNTSPCWGTPAGSTCCGARTTFSTTAWRRSSAWRAGRPSCWRLCFHAGKFTPAEAATWLAGRGFEPLLFVPNSGGDRGL